jgi:hypothetical protein
MPVRPRPDAFGRASDFGRTRGAGWFQNPMASRSSRTVPQAWEARDIKALIGLLDPAATATGDGGGLVSAAPRPIEGGEPIARYVIDLASKAPAGLTMLERSVNGQPGLIAQLDGVTVAVYAFEFASDRITRIWAVLNPDKLRPWTTS